MKACVTINFTESGISTVCKEVQSRKAYLPIIFTESGISTACKEEQSLKAHSPILVTELGMEYDFIPFPAGNRLRNDRFLLNNIPSDEK